MLRSFICAMIAVTMLTGCGVMFGPHDRTVPVKNNRLCGVAGGTVAADAILLLFAIAPGAVAFAVDHFTGALYYSDEECKG